MPASGSHQSDQPDLLLSVQNLSVDYYAANGTVHAVNNVNFTLKRGEILGVAGESGSGKSTLAYAVARLLRPPAVITGGEVIYYPHRNANSARDQRRGGSARLDVPFDILQLTPSELRVFRWNEMSIVFQSAMNALNPVLDIGTQIIDALKTHRPDMGPDACKRRALDLLHMVGIAGDRLRSYPHELSGGMRQRAVIAIALALKPELIIMDEPTTALDVVVQREILELISSLCKELGTALMFITHDLSLLLELADKIMVMYAGEMIEVGTSKDLYSDPRHPYSYGLLNSFPTLHGPRRRMVGIPGSPPDLRNALPGCSFHPRCPFAFQPCQQITPVLSSLASNNFNGHDRRVACHLYNPQHNRRSAPSRAEFASRYDTLAEGSRT